MANDMTEAAIRARREYNNNYNRNMTPEQKERRKAYHAEWRRRNKDKLAAYRRNYWEHKAAEQAEEEENANG